MYTFTLPKLRQFNRKLVRVSCTRCKLGHYFTLMGKW